MQTLDIHRPEMPDLQFVLLVTALCTSRLTVLNIPSPSAPQYLTAVGCSSTTARLRVGRRSGCWT